MIQRKLGVMNNLLLMKCSIKLLRTKIIVTTSLLPPEEIINTFTTKKRTNINQTPTCHVL